MTNNNPAFPPRIGVVWFIDGTFEIDAGIIPPSECYLSIHEHEAILAAELEKAAIELCHAEAAAREAALIDEDNALVAHTEAHRRWLLG